VDDNDNDDKTTIIKSYICVPCGKKWAQFVDSDDELKCPMCRSGYCLELCPHNNTRADCLVCEAVAELEAV
jgi:hypothetical protein